MLLKTQQSLKKLHEMYDGWIDRDALAFFEEIDRDEKRIPELESLQDHPYIQMLTEKAIEWFRVSLDKLTNREVAMKMTDEERAYFFAAMDWSIMTLDIICGSKQSLEKAIDDKVAMYANMKGI